MQIHKADLMLPKKHCLLDFNVLVNNGEFGKFLMAQKKQSGWHCLCFKKLDYK